MKTEALEIGFRPTLPELLHRAVDRFGDADYVVEWDRRISFRQAEERSAGIARRMLAAGVGKGTRVGIFLPTGLDWVLAWLACGRIGAMPMLFPTTYRAPELHQALRIGDVALLITVPSMFGKDTQRLLEDAIPGLATAGPGPLLDPSVPYLRSIWMVGESDRAWVTAIDYSAGASPDGGLLDAVESEVSPADPLLVIYTSGSSAEPKAVIHTHGATIRKEQFALNMALAAAVPGRILCAMPFFWVGGPQELLASLHSGAAVVAQDRFDLDRAMDLLERERCTAASGWATLLEEILQHPSFGSRDLSQLEIRPFAAGLVSSRGDPPNLGMTETFGPHRNRDWFDYKVVDPTTGEPLPDGEEGEFCVRGFGLTVGLYKKEREETFDADGYYHTGDRGYLENGQIWFTGRYSEMIKSAGANVAPLEVEHALGAIPGVRAAFVVGVPHAVRGEQVAAMVVPEAGQHLDADKLDVTLRASLSGYKVPRLWLVVDDDEVPRLPSGKPDKRSMRERFAASPEP